MKRKGGDKKKRKQILRIVVKIKRKKKAGKLRTIETFINKTFSGLSEIFFDQITAMLQNRF